MKNKLRFILKKIPFFYSICEKLGIVGRLFLLRRLPKNSIGIEIGVYEGDFSAQILKVVNPRKLYLVDPWEAQGGEMKDSWFGTEKTGGQSAMDARFDEVAARFKSEIGSGIVELVRNYSDAAVSKFEDDSVDWVYIDGNHLYEYVKKDLELYFSKMKEGGLMTGDDYNDGGWWKDGVKKAVDEFVENGYAEVVKLRGNQYILRKLSRHKL